MTGFGIRGAIWIPWAESTADRLDAVDLAILVDESDDHRCRGSSSRAKKAEASFRISLVCSRPRFSLRSLVSSSRSAGERPAPAMCPAERPLPELS